MFFCLCRKLETSSWAVSSGQEGGNEARGGRPRRKKDAAGGRRRELKSIAVGTSGGAPRRRAPLFSPGVPEVEEERRGPGGGACEVFAFCQGMLGLQLSAN